MSKLWPYNYRPLASEEFIAACEYIGFRVYINQQKGSHGAYFYVYRLNGSGQANDEFINFLEENKYIIDGDYRDFYISKTQCYNKFYVSYKLK